MRALRTWVLAIPLSLASPAAAAGPTINACKILTGGDLEAVFGQKVTAPGVDTSGTEGGGPLKGETKYVCAWWLGGKPLDDAATYVVVTVVSRAAQTEQERALLSNYRASESEMKKKGVAIDVTPIPGGDCRVYRRPEAPLTSCIGAGKGRGLVLDVKWPNGASAKPLIALVDKALARL